MDVFTPEELDSDMLNDLMDEINELYEASEQTLIELELTPQDNELQRSLFRSVHTIKGDLGLVGFTPMILMLQHMEDLLDMLRKGQIDYTSNMSDLVLIGMDKVKSFVEQVMQKGTAHYEQVVNDKVVDTIKLITPQNVAEHEGLLAKASAYLDPSRVNHDEGVEEVQSAATIRSGIPKNLSEEQQVDLLFFRELMKPIEKRSGYNEGRGDRIAKLALYINELSGNLIPEPQLAVACYVHDFGLSFLPIDVIQKRTELSDLEKNMLRSHVYKSARLLENLSQWDLARKIVMEHHEYIDGSGYPLGIDNDSICDGAKLLAILDKFEGLTHSSLEAGEQNLSMKEAFIRVNKDYKGRLSAKWLRLFNQAISDLLS